MNRLSTDGGATSVTLAAWQSVTSQDPHSIVSQPSALVLNAGSDDYHLLAKAPARDKGTAESVPLIDLEDSTRPQGDGFDIGAYEFRDQILRAPTSIQLRSQPDSPRNLRVETN